jgi:glutaryl-CoA dehydrogenase
VFEASDFYALDDELTEAQRGLRDRVRHWVDRRFLPVVARHWRDGTFPLELVPEMAALGCFGGTIHGYGCAAYSPLEYGLVMRELERGDTGLRTFASVQGALAMHAIHDFGTEAQKSTWLPGLARAEKLACFGLTEPDHGSNPGGMETTATETDGGFVLRGRKKWIGNANIADVAVIWARVGSDPSPRAVRGFLVDPRTAGFKATVIDGKMSLRAAYTCEIELDDCEIPADAILPGTRGLGSALSCLNHARYSIAWGTVGSALACFDEARRYTLERIQFGRPIGAFQLVQARLAEMLTDLTSAQLLAWRLAELKGSGRATPARISMAKMANVERALRVARAARDLLGAVGILEEHQCFRHMSNLESVRTYEGTLNMHLLVLGREITGISAFSPEA